MEVFRKNEQSGTEAGATPPLGEEDETRESGAGHNRGGSDSR